MSLRNLTPHPVSLATTDGVIITLPSEGDVRLGEVVENDGLAVDGEVNVRVVRIGYAPAALPDPVPGTTLIVSALVAQRHAGRSDLVYPALLVRDGEGNISHAGALARFAGDL